MVNSIHAIQMLILGLIFATLTVAAALTVAAVDANFQDFIEHTLPDNTDITSLVKARGKSHKIPAPKFGIPTKYISRNIASTSEGLDGVPDFIHAGHNITKLSSMLYRMIKQYDIKSMVDVPCRSHSSWMGRFLAGIKVKEGKVPFQYFCVDSSHIILDLASSRMPEMTTVGVNYIMRKFWKERIPTADLVFSWEGLEKMQVKNVHQFLKILKRGGRHKYWAVGSSPNVKTNLDSNVLNVRRAPFSYGLPLRIYKELGVPGVAVEKQMYLYQVTDMGKLKAEKKKEQ